MDMSWGGVILSGGQGSRMGYADKSSLIHGEKTFLDIIGNELHSLGVPCYLSRAAYKSGEPVQGFTVVEDTVRGKDGEWIGPMGGIWSCLEQTAEPFLFFVSCDMPLFRGRMAECLLKYWKPGVDAVLWRTRDGRLQPMCALYSRTCLRELRTRIHSQNYRMMDFLEHVNCVEAKTAKEHIPDTWFLNVNTPEIYKELGKKRLPVLAVSGRKDAGKTWLLEKLVGVLSGAGVRTAVIKHDGHEFEADVPDTDSFRMKKCFQIITTNPDPIIDFITVNLHHGATLEDVYGAFHHERKTMIITVLTRAQALALRRFIHANDPHAFMVITASTEIVGKGFLAS